MKPIYLALFGMALSFAANAQEENAGDDRCKTAQFRLQECAKKKDYKNMRESWEILVKECPKATQRTYTDGAAMLKWEMEQTQDVAEKKKIFNQLMDLYDQRVKYFGTNKKYPDYYILGRKAGDYIKYSPELTNDPTYTKAYNWLKEAIEKGGEKCDVYTFQDYFKISNELFKSNPTANRETYIADYMKITPILSAAAVNDSTYDAAKSYVDKLFARSGAAECGTLDKAYSAKIDQNKDNKDFLNDVLKLYRIADCKESAVYFKGSGYLHKLQPTASSACGMAAQAYSKKNYAEAIKYYQEAIKLETDKTSKSDYYYNIAALYSAQKNYTASKQNALSAISLDPTSGKAYILIAQLYAGYRDKISDDGVIQQTAYWAAVDKLEKAKAVDPDVAGQANKLISQYKQYFPDKSDLFMRGVKGGTYTVPGWIGETTNVR